MKVNVFFYIVLWIIYFSGTCSNASSSSIPYLNLDFEREVTIDPWSTVLSGFDYAIDTVNKSHGRQSLSISSTAIGDFIDTSLQGVASLTIPVNHLKSKKGTFIKISIDISAETTDGGYVNFVVAANSQSGNILDEKNLRNENIKGNSPWKKYKLVLLSDSDISYLTLNCIAVGKSKSWFDNISVSINDIDLLQAQNPVLPKITKNGLQAIKSKIVSFNQQKLFETPLDSFFNKFSIIGLGECSHGTHEFFSSKTKIIKHLIQKKGFNTVAFEANQAECEKINQYVLSRNEDQIDSLLLNLGFQCWMTEEVKELILWIKGYNQQNSNRVKFIGIDMQSGSGSAKEILNNNQYVRSMDSTYIQHYCSRYISILDDVYQGLYEPLDSLSIYAELLYSLLSKPDTNYHRKETADLKKLSLLYSDNLRQLARQLLFANDNSIRDSSMAVNLLNRISENDKVVVWAHNYHLRKEFPSMGHYINRSKIYKYGCLAMYFGIGQYNGFYQGKFQPVEALQPYPGTLEYACTLLSKAAFSLRLASVVDMGNISNNFLLATSSRVIGFSANRFSFNEDFATAQYDGIVYFPTSTPTRLLPIVYDTYQK